MQPSVMLLPLSISVIPGGIHPVLNIMHSLFNGQFLFVLRFLGGVVLVFIIGRIMGLLLHLDNAYKSGPKKHSSKLLDKF